MLETMTCPKCDHEWVLRTEKPMRCPKCGFKVWTVADVLKSHDHSK